jgi:hypothetical protein
MDDFGIAEPGKNEIDEPIPFDSDDAGGSVSHSPLDLSGGPVGAPKIDVPMKPVSKKATEKIVSTDRITGVKTFFAKLHVGAIEFLDEQITNWLKNNPDVTIKRTNTVTGEIQGKKTEPNIIISVWY